MTYIWVKFTQEGYHRWPSPSSGREYLRAPHRHLFHVKVSLSVEGKDREVEFHDLLEKARDFFETTICLVPTCPLGDWKEAWEKMLAQSCEHMAHSLLGELRAFYGNRAYVVEVSEDGECGATVSYVPTPQAAAQTLSTNTV